MVFIRRASVSRTAFHLGTLVATLLVSTSIGHAQAIIDPTAVTSPQGSFNSPYDLPNIINQSGLSTGYVSGVTNFNTYTATTTHNSTKSLNSGFTNQKGVPQQFTFNLGTVLSINALAFWRVHNIGSVTQFQLFSDSDNNFANGTGPQIGGTFNASSTTDFAQVFTFNPTTTQFVHLNVLNMAGGGSLFPGIGEIAFRQAPAATPEPGSVALLVGMGISGAGFLVRRRKNSR